ncbi:MAG: hypothetical protein M8866_05430 [marine benthic group bacterium]|nr:hypothetical protein [Candidatus Benthicola marisminoris]
MLRSLGLAVAAVAAVAAPLAAQEAEWTEVRARRQAGGVESLSVDLEYIAGELRIAPAGGDLLYDTRLRYDAARMRPERQWSVDDGAARLKFGFAGLGDDGDMELDFDDDEHGYLEMGLSETVPTDLNITVGAALSEVDVGGIPLTGLAYHTGASDTEIRFDSPNPVELGRIELAVGAAEFSASGLGNARFQELELKGGVGDVTLDFTGEWAGDADVSIHMGLGSLTLVFPPELGVQIDKKGFLAALDAPGFTKVDGAWQSESWDSAEHRLHVQLRAALGSIEVRQER